MADGLWNEAGRMAAAGGIVAAVAIPLALIAALAVRRQEVSLFPARKPWRAPWGGVELIGAFILVAVTPELLKAGGLAELSAGVLAFPIQVCLLFIAWRIFFPLWRPFRERLPAIMSDEPLGPRSSSAGLLFCRVLTVGVIAWSVITPLVLLINGLVTLAFAQLDLPVESHPLTRLAAGSAWEHSLFLFEACVGAPIIEEILFRGLLLPWAIGARERTTGGLAVQPLVPPSVRPLLVMVFGALYASGGGKAGPLVFAGVLGAGMAVLWVSVRHGKRHARAIYASSAFFALVHSSVWPSPIPLFFLGLGLGWLAVRTRGVLVPALVHGLFNAVSAVYVLRGAT